MDTSKVIKNIGAVGCVGVVNSYAGYIKRAMQEEIERQTYQALLQGCEKAKETENTTSSSLYEMVRHMAEDNKKLKELSDSFQELYADTLQEPTIDQLKKQIKYSKNPLEVKMLNKKLNQMYKEMKRR